MTEGSTRTARNVRLKILTHTIIFKLFISKLFSFSEEHTKARARPSRSWKFHVGHSCGFQGPKYLSHYLLLPTQGAYYQEHQSYVELCSGLWNGDIQVSREDLPVHCFLRRA